MFEAKALVPHPVFDDPVFNINALKPTAVLLLPVALASKADLPTPVLLDPVVLFERQLYPIAVM